MHQKAALSPRTVDVRVDVEEVSFHGTGLKQPV